MAQVFAGQLRDQRLTALDILRLGEPDAPESLADPPGERLLQELIQPPAKRSLSVRDVDRGMQRVRQRVRRRLVGRLPGNEPAFVAVLEVLVSLDLCCRSGARLRLSELCK